MFTDRKISPMTPARTDWLNWEHTVALPLGTALLVQLRRAPRGMAEFLDHLDNPVIRGRLCSIDGDTLALDLRSRRGQWATDRDNFVRARVTPSLFTVETPYEDCAFLRVAADGREVYRLVEVEDATDPRSIRVRDYRTMTEYQEMVVAEDDLVSEADLTEHAFRTLARSVVPAHPEADAC